uniref:Lactase n=1 Tax=Anas platyrhynchos platyrhynchos TaxID=8840 RepID=A0A493TY19_ANAPP
MAVVHSLFFFSCFSWGVGSSAYQTEGAWDMDGKGPSIWDAFTHTKGKVFRNETGDAACDGYYKLLKELNVNHYLLSISWPRIMPTGIKTLNDGVNVRGYTAWSLLDKFEWNKGFSERFGFYHVDFKNKDKPRYPKASVDYYKNIISANAHSG